MRASGVNEARTGEPSSCTTSRRRKEVTTVELQTWETPQFEEIGVAPEVTMYVAQMDD